MKILAVLFTLVLLASGAYAGYALLVVNPRVAEELRGNPDGERARRVMLLTLPGGKTLPVNYLREGNVIYVGADGPWWRSFRDAGADVSLLVRGERFRGTATLVLDDQAFVDDVFSRLRPAAPDWLPDWLNGKLVVIDLIDTGS